MTGPLTPPLDLITTAVLELLRTGGRTVYDAAYTGDPHNPPYPYDVLYQLPGGSADPFPSLDDRHTDATLVFQVTAVSDLRNQAQWAARAARDLMVGKTSAGFDQPHKFAHPLVLPDGWVCIDRRPDPAMPGVERTGLEPNSIYTVPARYYLTVAPD